MTPAAPITCAVIHVHDGDGPFLCGNGTKIRAAGVQAPDYEDAPPCRQHRPSYVCDDRLAAASQRIAARLVMGKTLACQPVGRSHARVVARCRLPDGRDLSCALVAAGAADVWPVYWRRYRMRRCG